MDFLDPRKQRAHQIRLLVGYVLLAVAVALATTVLLYQAHGFGIKQGKVIQNGLVFVNSNPGPASIRLNGKTVDNTNARLSLEAGSYTMQLSREGYRDWQRALTVEGGSVEHFVYPYLVPKELETTTLSTYAAAPAMTMQSPDRRWLLVAQPGQTGVFDEYDAKDPEKTAGLKRQVAVPPATFGLPVTAASKLEIVDWSNDNIHVMLRHVSGDQSEYIMFSRKTPAESVNLSRLLQLTPNLALTLQDKKYDRYFIHDTAANTLSTASLANAQPVPMLNGVLTYKTYGTDTVLYISPDSKQTDKVQVRLYQGKKQTTVRSLPAGGTYLLALSRFDNSWYVAAGTPSENRAYIYRNPAESSQRTPSQPAVPVAVLKVANPTNLAFSANSQLIMAQSGTDFAIYDADYDRSHTYRMDLPVDPPQAKVSWMDSHHLMYISGGKTVIFDYDGTNVQTLSAQTPGLTPLFDTGYTTLYTIAKPETAGLNPEAHSLSATALRLPADQ